MPSLLEKALHTWLAQITGTENPAPNVIAYNFGLFETNEGYAVYLIGAAAFDIKDSSWACDEAFTPKERYLNLTNTQLPLGDWKSAHFQIAEALKNCLAYPDIKPSFLGKATAVTVGFDDGDLERIL